MKPTKHSGTTFRLLEPFLNAVDRAEGRHKKFHSPGFMDLSMEYLGYADRHGFPVYAMAHYGEQNGDLMADPDMTFSVDRDAGRVEALTWQNDYLGRYDEVYRRRDDGALLYSPSIRTSLDDFLWRWAKNLQDQGFDPAEAAA